MFTCLLLEGTAAAQGSQGRGSAGLSRYQPLLLLPLLQLQETVVQDSTAARLVSLQQQPAWLLQLLPQVHPLPRLGTAQQLLLHQVAVEV
jgi:hypothetical protein